LLGFLKHKETNIKNSSSSNIIRDIRDSKVEQSLKGRVVRSGDICQTNHIHTSISNFLVSTILIALPQDRVLFQAKLFNQGIGTFFLSIHNKSQGHSNRSDDLLVLSFMGISEQVLNNVLVGTSHHG